MRHLTATVLAALLTLCIAGCGGGSDNNDGSGSSESDAQLESPMTSLNERDFAERPELNANPDDIVTLNLEHPDADGGVGDTGGAPGTDVVPYYFPETAEHRFCWLADPNETPDGEPHTMVLRAAGGREVVRVEEGGECETVVVEEGRYTATFRHADRNGDDEDVVFVVPQPAEDAAAAVEDDALPDEPTEAAASAGGETAGLGDVPSCTYRHIDSVGPLASGEAMLFALIFVEGERLPRLDAFVVSGVCTDTRMITGSFDPTAPHAFAVALTAPNTTIRVFDEPFFQGRRRAIAVPHSVSNIDELVKNGFLPGGSLASVTGEPRDNRDITIRTRNCDRCNLVSADLHDLDLQKVSMVNADLTFADLSNAKLQEANLAGALLQSANLSGATLHLTNFIGASFDSAGPAQEGLRFPGADLHAVYGIKTVFIGASLREVNLRDVDMTGVFFDGANLDDADARGAKIHFSSMTYASARRATMNPASLVGTFVQHSNFTATHFEGATLQRMTLDDATLQGAFLAGAKLSGSSMISTNFAGADLSQTVFSPDLTLGIPLGAVLRNAYLANARLDDADLREADLTGARLYGPQASARRADFSKANLTNAVLSGTKLTNATLRSTNLEKVACVNCDLSGAQMSPAPDGPPTSFARADLRGASFGGATVTGGRFAGAQVSFDSGTYTYGSSPDLVYTADFLPTVLGPLSTDASIQCPDGGNGPCSTRDRFVVR